MADNPNFPAIIHRSVDDIAESNAITAGIRILDMLPPETLNQLGAWLDRETGVYAAEDVRELHKNAI